MAGDLNRRGLGALGLGVLALGLLPRAARALTVDEARALVDKLIA